MAPMYRVGEMLGGGVGGRGVSSPRYMVSTIRDRKQKHLGGREPRRGEWGSNRKWLTRGELILRPWGEWRAVGRLENWHPLAYGWLKGRWGWKLYRITLVGAIYTLHCKTRLAVFLSPAGMSLTLAENNLIIPGRGEFGNWHPGRGRENH